MEEERVGTLYAQGEILIIVHGDEVPELLDQAVTEVHVWPPVFVIKGGSHQDFVRTIETPQAARTILRSKKEVLRTNHWRFKRPAAHSHTPIRVTATLRIPFEVVRNKGDAEPTVCTEFVPSILGLDTEAWEQVQDLVKARTHEEYGGACRFVQVDADALRVETSWITPPRMASA